MTLKIDIENFQSITKASMEFDVGINLLSGSNNAGKSAVIRALRCVLTNPFPSSKSFIQFGKHKARVSLNIEGYPEVIWERTPKKTEYIIGGELYSSVGRSGALDLIDSDLGFVVHDKKILNIHDEYDYLFPFSYSDTELFALFESIFQICDAKQVITLVKKDANDLQTELLACSTRLKNIGAQVSQLRDFLEGLNPEYLRESKQYFKNQKSLYRSISNDLITTCETREVLDSLEISEVREFVFSDPTLVTDYYTTIDLKNSIVDIDDTVIEFENISTEIIEDLNTIKEYQNQIDLMDLDTLNIDIIDHTLCVDFYTVTTARVQLNMIYSEISALEHTTADILDQLSKVDQCPLCGGSVQGLSPENLSILK